MGGEIAKGVNKNNNEDGSQNADKCETESEITEQTLTFAIQQIAAPRWKRTENICALKNLIKARSRVTPNGSTLYYN